jgi:L-glutamine-phosphate cytidylyltransferase
MKIIILAAGKGERLMPLTRNTPKPLLDLGNGMTLLEQQIRSIRRSEAIDEIVLVVGYLAEQIEAKIHRYTRERVAVRTVFNPFYAHSNNLMSLWMARHEMDGDFMVTNGDNLFTPDVFADFAGHAREGVWLSIHVKEAYDDDDMKVTLEEGLVARAHKRVDPARVHAESPGLCCVRGPRARRLFVDQLEALARDGSYIDRYWLEVFNAMYERGVAIRPWAFDADSRWQEVDFHADCKKLQDLVRGHLAVAEGEGAVHLQAELRAVLGAA